mgnify:CR=1 FL=1
MTELNPDQFRSIAGHYILNELSDRLDPIWDKYEEAFTSRDPKRPTYATPKVAKTFMGMSQALYDAQNSHDDNDPAGAWYHLNALNDHLHDFTNHLVTEYFEGRVPAEKLHELNSHLMLGISHVNRAKHEYSELYRIQEPPKEEPPKEK